METERRDLTGEDGSVITLRVFEPSAQAQVTVVIGGAMGVPQGYYAPYAQWLAQQGYRVWTFDYRGHGDSLAHVPRRSLRGFKADLFDWARDYETVVLTARRELPARPLYLLGHSLGAQLPGLFHHPDQVDGLFSIAAGSGYWRENAPQLRRRVLFFWHVMVPLATRVCGYFPGRRLGMVGNLPAGVIHQWRRWCMHPRYSAGAEGQDVAQRYGRVRFPLLAWSFSDDELMTLRGTHSLINLYSAAPRQVLTIHPVEVPSRRIGHFGFFREVMHPTLWPRSLAALQSLAAGAVPPGTQAVATTVHTMQP